MQNDSQLPSTVSPSRQELEFKLKKLELLEARRKLKEGLPHLHAYPLYPWARRFFDSTNPNIFLVAANQIGKSSTQIRKIIHWATATDQWPTIFTRRRPLCFWYLYPTKDIISAEFTTKWEPEWLPRNEYKDHPQFGWEVQWKDRSPYTITFRSGVTLFFKTYAQDVHALQSSTVDYVAFDEELPEELFDELSMRREAVDGYLSGVFTATRGQDIWRRAFEERGKEEEAFKTALKIQVSMYDCQFYEDGSPTHWTNEKIERAKNSCKSDTEVRRRIYGEFVQETGLKYQAFDRTKNIGKPVLIPEDWSIYAGVDIGQGGQGHPAAIVFVAVSPDYRSGRVFMGWRGPKGLHTTNSDILEQYVQMKGGLSVREQYYDWHSKDFFLLATRRGLPFIPAEKDRALGVQMLNVLFRNEMLSIDELPELDPLCTELASLREDTQKQKARDDFCDALRYAVTKIPWDWEAIKSEAVERATKIQPPIIKEKSEGERRREHWLGKKEATELSIEEELAEWDGLINS